MKSKEEFKAFVKEHPELIKYVKSEEMSWQKFYELYSLYDEDNEAWDPYLKKEETNNTSENDYTTTNNNNNNSSRVSTPSLNDVFNTFKNIKPEVLQQNITSIQKFLGFVSEFVGDKESNPITKNIYTPRPTNKIFED